ncbi:MAG: PEGA domain-containing protein [Kiritimatiellia bacterium]
MKKSPIALAAVLVALSAFADPVKALLVVQNHTGAECLLKLPNLATRLSAALSGDVLEVIDPNDVIGEDQNRSVKGENMPLSSATRLAENLGAAALVTASIDDISEVTVGSPAIARQLTVTMTLQAKRVPSGGGTGGVEVMALSRKYTPDDMRQNQRAIYAQLMSQICKNAAQQLLPQVAKVSWTAPAQKVMVAFGCNYPGADVSIDGVSYGTAGTIGEAPLQVPVSPGIHNLTVSYPFAEPYRVQAHFMPNSTYVISLQPTEEGRRRRKDDAYFAQLLDRAAKSGATDDFCRTERAKGYARYLASSHTRIEGMPQVLAKWNWGNANQSPELGLKPEQGDEQVESTETVLKKAAEQVERK